MKPSGSSGFYVVAYAPRRGLPVEDYNDFPLGMVLNFHDVQATITLGNFPPGLVLQAPGGQPCVVVGQYGNQEFRPLTPAVISKEEKHET